MATSNFELDRPLPKGKNKKVFRLMKDESGVQIMKEFVGLSAKHVTIWKTTTIKIKKPQVCVSWKENWNLKIIKSV